MFVLSFISLGLMSCSSSGSSVPKNAICAKKYEPLELGKEDTYSSKMPLKKGEAFKPNPDLTPVEFAYSGVDFYFYDTEKNFKIHLRQSKDEKTNTFGKAEIVCVGGSAMKQDMAELNYEFTFVSDFKSDGTDGADNIEIKTKTIWFKIGAKSNGKPWLETGIKNESPRYERGRPQEFYDGDGFDNSEQYFLALKSQPDNFQLLNRLESSLREVNSTPVKKLIVRSLVNLKKPVAAE